MIWIACALLPMGCVAVFVVGFFCGHKRGYEYARLLVGAEKLPAYDKLHEELP